MSDYSPLLAALQAEQNRITLDRAHRYRYEGKYLPGVTTIIKVMDAPRLDEWKVRVQVEGTARTAHANPPVFGEDVEGYVARLVALAGREYEHKRQSDQAADLGNQVHALVDFAIKSMLGQPVELPDVSEEAHYAFAGWREWAKEEDFQPLVSEARVVNRVVGYCGTVDALGLVRGRLTVIDTKPNATVYPERRLQLAAYAAALRSMGWPPMDRAIVSLPRDGGEIRLVPLGDPVDETFQSFLACLDLYRWQARMRNLKRGESHEQVSSLPPPAA